jgi:DNA processing protein
MSSELATNIQKIALNHDQYPRALREIAESPQWLYLRGDTDLLAYEPKVAIIGSRQHSEYGARVAAELGAGLARAGVCVVSGLALGIDALAHKAALRVGGKTLAVLGTAIDDLYPARNRALAQQIIDQGLVLSEQAPGTELRNWHFSARNRIISGLSQAVVVVEAAEKSGTLITARCALDQGREVFAIPGPVTSELSKGTLQLIREGARCVRSSGDVLEDLGLLSLQVAKPVLSNRLTKESSDKLLRHFGADALHIDILLEKTGLKASELSNLLLERELSGQVRQLPGQYYVRN